jgi:hypothetical protein
MVVGARPLKVMDWILDVPALQTQEMGVIQERFVIGVKKDMKALVDTFDEFLKPLVLHPWGCTEYHHRCGHIAFDVVLQQYFQHLTFH